ncbi:MAG TPA: (4Fe-4S)-binding protein [Methylibium sp.]|nr:(4Fe-4S)-binding protein [Methylibium sp.]
MSMQIAWDEKKCCHSANCVKTLPQVFMVEGGKFVIKPEAAPEDQVRAVVAACPSAAFTIQSSN